MVKNKKTYNEKTIPKILTSKYSNVRIYAIVKRHNTFLHTNKNYFKNTPCNYKVQKYCVSSTTEAKNNVLPKIKKEMKDFDLEIIELKSVPRKHHLELDLKKETLTLTGSKVHPHFFHKKVDCTLWKKRLNEVNESRANQLIIYKKQRI